MVPRPRTAWWRPSEAVTCSRHPLVHLMRAQSCGEAKWETIAAVSSAAGDRRKMYRLQLVRAKHAIRARRGWRRARVLMCEVMQEILQLSLMLTSLVATTVRHEVRGHLCLCQSRSVLPRERCVRVLLPRAFFSTSTGFHPHVLTVHTLQYVKLDSAHYAGCKKPTRGAQP
jgi:hypothetical protein